jgi:4-hydroxy-3-polyprenylbenzoate decarboxylase
LAYESLREWLKALDRAGELKRVKAEVSPILEMAEVADRAAKSGKGTAEAGGPALLFENVTGYKGARVLMNQFGSEKRMKLALEVDSLNDVAKRIERLIHPVAPAGLMDKLKMLPMLAGFSRRPSIKRMPRARKLCCSVTMWTC